MSVPAAARPAQRGPTLIIMARAPVPGATKTRLRPLLGDEGCARLQAGLIRRCVALGVALGWAAHVAHTPSGSASLLRPLVGPDTVLLDQRGDDLGARMAAAVHDVTAAAPGPVVLIGTDCPLLGPAHLRAAADRLADGHDVVLGPAHDGGYYLIALARPTPAVFALPVGLWGGPQVAAHTRHAARAAGLTLATIEPEHDLDTPQDAATLLRDPRLPADVRALLRPP